MSEPCCVLAEARRRLGDRAYVRPLVVDGWHLREVGVVDPETGALTMLGRGLTWPEALESASRRAVA